MAKLAAAAVVEAIRKLAALDLPSREAAALEAYLTAKRLAAKGRHITIQAVNDVVEELFAVLPDHAKGRIHPFYRNRQLSEPVPKWRLRDSSGRKTVWNMTTRGQRNLAGQLFQQGDIRRGLQATAADVLSQALAGRPSRQALAVLLLRNEEFPGAPDEVSVAERFAATIGVTDEEVSRFCSDDPIGVPLAGTPEWRSEALPALLRPAATAAGAVATVPASAASADAGLIVDERVRRMVRLAVVSSRAVMLVGPPGTGKTALLNELINEVRGAPAAHGFSHCITEPLWQTPEEGWTARELLGGDTVFEQHITFRPGLVLEAIASDRWVVLDEANRADMDKIFGGMLTWLSGQSVKLGRASAAADSPLIELGWNHGHPECTTTTHGNVPTTYLAGDDWRLLGTYNAVDSQRIFRFGQALGRRFARVPIPPMTPEQFDELIETQADDVPVVVRRAVSDLYSAHYDTKQPLGPASFIQILEYVRGAVRKYSADKARNFLAEGYLIHVGTWMARMEEKELDELHERVVVEADAISKDDWQWLRKLLVSLA